MKKHSSVLVEFSQSIYELYFFGRENENESNFFCRYVSGLHANSRLNYLCHSYHRVQRRCVCR